MKEFKVKIYKLKNGRFQISYYDPFSMKRVRKKFASFEQAKNEKRALENEINFDGNKNPKHKNILGYIDEYIEKFPNTSFLERKNTYHSFRERFGDYNPNDINRNNLIEWFNFINSRNNYTVLVKNQAALKYTGS